MGYEVELKFRAVEHAELAKRLAELGASAEPPVAQEDLYLAHPCRDFAQTNEAFRIRRVGHDNFVTYKGPKHPGATKTREEIEIPVLASEEGFARVRVLLERLGFSPVATIRKVRTTFRLEYAGRSLEVALDAAEQIGDFAEVETLAASQEDLPHAQDAVLECAKALGLNQVEPRSYLRMALERADAAPHSHPAMATSLPDR
ncbi:MAG: class IV adenylate cyclase [Isosphaeraceae bacterium]|nr:class IV adenylate cyclase [Isosphaeraceae bacterium]